MSSKRGPPHQHIPISACVKTQHPGSVDLARRRTRSTRDESAVGVNTNTGTEQADMLGNLLERIGDFQQETGDPTWDPNLVRQS